MTEILSAKLSSRIVQYCLTSRSCAELSVQSGIDETVLKGVLTKEVALDIEQLDALSKVVGVVPPVMMCRAMESMEPGDETRQRVLRRLWAFICAEYPDDVAKTMLPYSDNKDANK